VGRWHLQHEMVYRLPSLTGISVKGRRLKRLGGSALLTVMNHFFDKTNHIEGIERFG